MHIGLVRLLKRRMPGPLLKKLWCPPLLCQGCEHRVAKNVWRDRNARMGSSSPKERIDICIRQCLARSRSMLFDEHMVGFDLSRVCDPNVGYNLVDEIC